jgi:CHAT domain-containing protein
LSRRSAAYRETVKSATLEELMAALPADAALVDYLEYLHSQPSPTKKGHFDGRTSLLAFVVRPGRPVEMFDLGPVAPVSDAIDAWRSSFGMSPEAQAAGQRLRKKIWEPLIAAIGDANLVLISPDSTLGRLPLGALPGKEPGSYLLEDYRVALIAMPQLIPALVNDLGKKQLEKELFLLGGVDYDRRAGEEPSAEPAVPAAPLRPWQRRSNDALALRAIAGNQRWPFLAASDSEVAFIKNLYQQATQLPADTDRVADLRGAAATEEQFRQLAPKSYILHLATHGFFAAPDKQSALAAAGQRGERGNRFGDRREVVRGFSPGLLSGLVLAGANNPPPIPDDTEKLRDMPDDGILTAEEIAFLPLGGAQLVVLSACETGLGETAGGEGLLGIQRAFQVAGARTTIASLWKVNDEATRRIMEEFYRNYLEHRMSPLDALRAAQLWALNNPDLVPRGADPPKEGTAPSRLPPQYWAAFTLSGDWR